MKITYLGHSGYLVELCDCYCLFDYYVGTIPELSEKPLFVFVSHQHQDHYNPEIFLLAEKYRDVCFILPPDVKTNPGKLPVLNREQCRELKEKGCVALPQSSLLKQAMLYRIKARQEYQIRLGAVELSFRTLRSTDSGVAYLLMRQDAVIFHAGDLNWWHWEGEEKQFNNNMAANYKREIDTLSETPVDVAFLPIDPRQGQHFWLGYDYFLRNVPVKAVFPMHFMEDTRIIERFRKQEKCAKMLEDKSMVRLFEPLKKGERIELCVTEQFMEVVPEEKEEVMALYRAMLGREGCAWNEAYPAEENFDYDVSHHNLFCMKSQAGEIIAVISIDDDEEVAALPNWDIRFKKAGELARLAVCVKEQNRGLARRMIQMAMQVLRERGYDAVHYLVSPTNPAALASYAKLAFSYAGEAFLYERNWLLYEQGL